MPAEGQLAHVKTPPPPVVAGDPINGVNMPREEYTISLVAAADGEIAMMSLRGPTRAATEVRTYDALQQELKAIPRPAGQGTGVAITIESSNDLRYTRLVDVLDVCKRAGFASVNLSPYRPGPHM